MDHAPLRFETKVTVRPLFTKGPKMGFVSKTILANRRKSSILAIRFEPMKSSIKDQSGAITPKQAGALMPENDN
jgi:hypothetical protein